MTGRTQAEKDLYRLLLQARGFVSYSKFRYTRELKRKLMSFDEPAPEAANTVSDSGDRPSDTH
jgi:hypothetical protein